MRRPFSSFDWASTRALIVIGILFGLAFSVGSMIARFHFGVRELVIFTVVVLLGGFILVPSQRVLRLGFFFWILTFGFGWRTIYLTPNLNIHPSEVTVTLLFVAMLAVAIVRRERIDFSIPVLIPLFLMFAVLGVVTALIQGARVDVVVEQFKVFIALIPSYYVVKWLVVTRQDWERAAVVAVAVVFYVSLLGQMEYFSPGLSRDLSGNPSSNQQFVTYAQSIDNSVSFGRVGFAFYGSYTAGFLIFTFFGISTYYFIRSWRNGVRALVVAGIVLLAELVAMYLSGYRGLWYAIGVFFLAFAFVRRQGWLLLGAAIVSIPFLPIDFWLRFSSLVNQQYADSSQFDRFARAANALDLMRQSPLIGVGWGGSGYVHSDLAQIGANLGVIALAVFVLWILSLTWKMLRMSRHADWESGYAGVLFASMCGLLVLFAGEGQIVFVQLMIPIWFLFAMAYKLFESGFHEGAESTILNRGQ